MMIPNRRPDDVALAADGLPKFSRLEKLLMAAAIGVAALAVIDNAFALDRPTRDQVEALPVWGVEICLKEPTADHRLCWFLTPPDLDQASCLPIEHAAAARFKGARHVRCIPDPERVARIHRWVIGPWIYETAEPRRP